jgi:hypothetical protein
VTPDLCQEHKITELLQHIKGINESMLKLCNKDKYSIVMNGKVA